MHNSILTIGPITRPLAALLLPAVLLLVVVACGSGDEIDLTTVYDVRLGGDTTAFTRNRSAFELSARNLDNDLRTAFEVGDSFFTQNWVIAPASTQARDGLGPTHNAISCSSCHALDGRAKPPDHPGDPERGLLLRLSIPGPDGPIDEPTYGGQLQDRSILGVPAEGQIVISYKEVQGQYPDGTQYSLRQPTYSIADLAFGPMHAQVQVSPRIAPAIIGMGLLEAIPEANILGLADPDDANGDGISGRPNYVSDVKKGSSTLGRFGWKANQPTLEQQAAGAFLGDIGITSSIFPEENCPASQEACQEAPNGGTPEVVERRLDRVTTYVQTLAVPAMRDPEDETVQQGARLFVQSQCSLCHTTRHETGDDHPLAPLRNQVIFPYTDLLLHDMGPGLADNRPDGQATGSEWRTPPLWGIGLVDTVNGHTMFLHDGRARNVEEAILWHGGEAEESRQSFMVLTADERDALLRFLESL